MNIKFISIIALFIFNTEISLSSFRTIRSIDHQIQQISGEQKNVIINAYDQNKVSLETPYSEDTLLNNIYSSLLLLNKTSPKDIRQLIDKYRYEATNTVSYAPAQRVSGKLTISNDIPVISPACSAPPTVKITDTKIRSSSETIDLPRDNITQSSSLAGSPQDKLTIIHELNSRTDIRTHAGIVENKILQGHSIIIVLGAFHSERNHFIFDSLISSSGKPPFVIYIDEINYEYTSAFENELFIQGDFTSLEFLGKLKSILDQKVDLITVDKSVSKFINLNAYSLDLMLGMLKSGGKFILDYNMQMYPIFENLKDENDVLQYVEKHYYNPYHPQEYILKKAGAIYCKKIVTNRHYKNSPEFIELKNTMDEIYPTYFDLWIDANLGTDYKDRFIFQLEKNINSGYWSTPTSPETLFICITRK